MQRIKPENHFKRCCKTFFLIAIFVLGGCASSNEGKVDFRKTDIMRSVFLNTSSTKEIVFHEAPPEKRSTPGVYQELQFKNFPLSKEKASNFAVGDSLSLHLRSAYIHDFTEFKAIERLTNYFDPRQVGKTTGEIAVVANAFEEVDGKELSFGNMREGRVVFYSEDVRRKQFLNFNNMPIYGPLTFKGAPVAFRIAIFELDTVSNQSKAMLSTIAQAGARAFPPSSPVLNILNSLGATFFDSDQIDTEFRYTMILDPNGGSEKLNHFTLQVGNYVFIRSEDRTKEVPWDKLVLDENTAIVYWKDKKDEAGKLEPYTDNTYLIVEINKNISHLGVELAENNFGSLLAALKNKDKGQAGNWKSTHNALMSVAYQREQLINFSRAKEILKELNDDNLSVFEKRSEAEKLFTMISNSLFKEDSSVKIMKIEPKKPYIPTLSEQHINYLMKKIRSLAEKNLLTAGKLNETTYELLSLSEIYKKFKGAEKTNKKEILNIIAPIPTVKRPEPEVVAPESEVVIPKPEAGAEFNKYDFTTVEGRQQALKDIGYYTGAVDGIWGKNSKKALTIFQEKNNLAADGKWGTKTEEKVKSALEEKKVE